MDITFFADVRDFRAWLEQHHDSAPELWVGFYKKSAQKPGLSYPEAVDQALCFGWIDGIRKTHDSQAYTNRFTPRRKGSYWSLVNVRKVEQLTRDGLMRPAGIAALKARTPEKTGVYSSEQTKLSLENEHELLANPAAAAYWKAAAPSYRKQATWWVISAKREETRAARMAQLINCCSRGVKVPPFRRAGEPS